MKDTINFKCRNCGHKYNVQIYPVINLNEEQNKSLMDGLFTMNIFHTTCPECEVTQPLLYNCLVIEVFRKYIIYFCSKNDKVDINLLEMYLQKIYPDMWEKFDKSRIVYSPIDLIETINIFDFNLNDKVIKEIKKTLLASSANHDFVYFSKMVNTSLIFHAINTTDKTVKPIEMSVDMSVYNQTIDSTGITPEKEVQHFQVI